MRNDTSGYWKPQPHEIPKPVRQCEKCLQVIYWNVAVFLNYSDDKAHRCQRIPKVRPVGLPKVRKRLGRPVGLKVDQRMVEQLKTLRAEGLTLPQICLRLNDADLRTSHGLPWSRANVSRLMNALGMEKKKAGRPKGRSAT